MARPKGMLCLTFTLSGPKVSSNLEVMFMLSVISEGVLLDVEWGENCSENQVERLVPVYHKTKVQSLQSFPRGIFASWASNGSCEEEFGNF